jgi:glycosyltransferase involved in cell wall biosynthesis
VPAAAIAFDVTPLQNAHRYRGIGTYVRGLAQRLGAQKDIPIEFWGWEGPDQLEIQPPHRGVWLPMRATPQYRGAWLFARYVMRQRVAKSKASVVHVTDPDALGPLRGRTLLTTVYDLIPLKEPQHRRRVVANLGYWSYLNSLRHADLLFAISQQTATDLVDMLHLNAGRILVARPGIDLPTPQGLHADGGHPYFLYVGGPNPNKNLALVLDAMAVATDLDEELRIAGHWLPKQVEALKRQIAASGLSGRARHIGFVPASELADLMANATALVIPSLHEGFGLPVAEGLAAGAVVVHSDLPVLRETSAGAALIFASRSVSGLAACLRQASRDTELTERLRAQGLDRAKALTWDDAVKTTLTAYDSLLK